MSKGTEKSGGTDTTHSSPNLKFSTYDTSRVYSRVYSYIPAGTVHTGKASLHYGHACVSQGGSAE